MTNSDSTNKGKLDLLYQEILMDHHRDPRCFGKLDSPDVTAEGHNPLCGDRVLIQMNICKKSGQAPCERGEPCICIERIRFQGEGCSICMASASMMAEEVEGKALDKVLGMAQNFRLALQGHAGCPALEGDLQALEGVKKFPVRMKCALLPWTTLMQAVQEAQTVGKE